MKIKVKTKLQKRMKTKSSLPKNLAAAHADILFLRWRIEELTDELSLRLSQMNDFYEYEPVKKIIQMIEETHKMANDLSQMGVIMKSDHNLLYERIIAEFRQIKIKQVQENKK